MHRLLRLRETDFGIEGSVPLLDAQTAVGDGSQAAPLERSPQLEHLRHQGLRLEIAVVRNAAGELILHLRPAVVQLAHQHAHGLQHVERLEAGDHHRPLVFLCEKIVGTAADDGAHVRRADESVDAHGTQLAHVGRIENALDGRGCEHMVAKHAEVPEPQGFRLPDRDRGRRRGSLKSDGEENDLPVGIVLRDVDGLGAGINHADVASLGARFQQAALARAGHAQHVAVTAQDDVGIVGKRDRHIEAADGQDAHRTTGPVHQMHVRWKQVLDAVTENRVRVAAAKFHQAVIARGIDLGAERGSESRSHALVAKFTDVLHAGFVPGGGRSRRKAPAFFRPPPRRGA